MIDVPPLDYIVYLSSTSYHWWNFVSNNWKKNLIDGISMRHKDINFIDPLKFKSNDPSVCPMDLDDINRSNYIAIYLNKITIGTMLELGYCIYKKLKFGILTFNKKVVNHPWIQHLCGNSIFTDYISICNDIVLDYTITKFSKGQQRCQERNQKKP